MNQIFAGRRFKDYTFQVTRIEEWESRHNLDSLIKYPKVSTCQKSSRENQGQRQKEEAFVVDFHCLVKHVKHNKGNERVQNLGSVKDS